MLWRRQRPRHGAALGGRHRPGSSPAPGPRRRREVGRLRSGRPGPASAGHDRIVRLWEAATGDPRWLDSGHRDQVEAATFAPHGKTLASAGARPDGSPLGRSGREGPLRQLTGHQRSLFMPSLSPLTAPHSVLGGSRDCTIRFWDPTTGKEVRQVKGPGWGLCHRIHPHSPAGVGRAQDEMVHLLGVLPAPVT